ncbi:MAG TPA: hypothetical protein VEA69_19740 [Tepidisphaeraceae bacterium]|nr:hypothetical protein [Tepidisphaeraceae bacterium]
MDPKLIMLQVAEALETLDVQYMLVGSFSSNAYGIPRSTFDADFVIEATTIDFGALARALGPDLNVEQQLQLETVTGRSRYVARHTAVDFTVELFLLDEDPHNAERFARRRRSNMFGRPVWLPTAEDVVIQKLRWYGRARRHKDYDDVKDVLAVQRDNLDFDYIRAWCDRHGTRAILEELLQRLPRV